MKYRSDFVTNSSSSSFIVFKKNLTQKQINAFKNHLKYAKCKKWKDWKDWEDGEYQWRSYDQWTLYRETDEYLEFHTVVNNFDMEWFARKLGVNDSDFRNMPD